MASDERTDIYALGVLIKQMFPENRRMQKIGEKAASFSPADRYQSVKELQRDLMEKPNLFYVLIHPPGLRRKKIALNLISGFLYVVFIAAVISNNNLHDPSQMITNLCAMFIVFNWIDLYGHWTGLFDKFPLIQDQRWYLRVLGYILTTIMIIIFWGMIIGMLNSFLK